MAQRTLALQPKWFSEASPTNPHKASKNFGAGENGIVSVYYDKIGTEGNAIKIEVVEQTGSNKDMKVAFASGKLTITLGQDGTGAISDTANTAKLIATAINALPDFNATYTGTGATPYKTAFVAEVLTGGSYGTPSIIRDVIVYVSPYYYWCEKEGSEYTVVWKRFTPATY